MLTTADLSFIRQLKAPRTGFLTAAYKHGLTNVPRGQAECQWYPPRDGTRPKAVVVFFPGTPFPFSLFHSRRAELTRKRTL